MQADTTEAFEGETKKMDMEQYARGYALVDLDAVVSNIKAMAAHVRPGTRILAVIKTDAYGHGSIPIAKALEKLDFMYGFAVEKNGLIYPNKDFTKFYENVTKLIQNPNMINALGKEAYRTITEEWNAKVAADRLIPFLKKVIEGEVIPQKTKWS